MKKWYHIWYDIIYKKYDIIYDMIWYVQISISEGDLRAGLCPCFIFQARLLLWWSLFSCGQMIKILNYDYDY